MKHFSSKFSIPLRISERGWNSVPGFRKEEVLIELKKEFGQKFISEEQNEFVEENWKLRTKENPLIFNAPKFRLSSLEQKDNKVILRVGITDYKSYLGTNHAPPSHLQHLQKEGRLKGDENYYLSNPLGNAAVVETKDKKIIFIKRSNFVSEAQGLVDMPGGHPEVNHILSQLVNDRQINIKSSISFEDCDSILLSDNQLQEQKNKIEELIKEELFSSITMEIVDEINIPLSTLSEPVLMGLVTNDTIGKKPSMLFYVKVDLLFEEVATYYSKGPKESFETTGLLCFEKQEILKDSFLRTSLLSFTITTEAYLQLIQLIPNEQTK